MISPSAYNIFLEGKNGMDYAPGVSFLKIRYYGDKSQHMGYPHDLIEPARNLSLYQGKELPQVFNPPIGQFPPRRRIHQGRQFE